MKETTDKVGRGLFSIVEWVGFVILVLLAVITPLFFVPTVIFRSYVIEGAEIIMSKWVFIQGMVMLAGVVGGLALLGPAWRRYWSPAFLPALSLALFLVWAAICILINPVPGHSFNEWMPRLGLGICALLGVMFLPNWRRCRVMVVGMLVTATLVGAIGVIGGLGVREINRFVYGGDPRDAIEMYQERGITRQVQGGMVSSGSVSTLGNPEYAGTFSAAMAVLATMVLFDWVPRTRRRLLWRSLLVPLIGLLLLHLVLTSSRQAWVTIFLCGLLRVFLLLDIPRRLLAGGFCLLLAVTVIGGLIPAMVLGALFLAGALFWSYRAGTLLPFIRTADRFNVILVSSLLIVIFTGLVAFSVPGPWNTSGVRVLQRFASLMDRRDDSLRERMLMYAVASDVTWRNPVFGAGPGRYGNEYLPTLARLSQRDESGAILDARRRTVGYLAVQSHNDYLQIAAETGIPGIVLFLTMLLSIFYGLDRVRRRGGWPGAIALALMVMLAGFCSIMMTSFPLQVPGRSTIFWSLIGTCLGLLAGSEGQEEEGTSGEPDS
ncbi:MAG: O-antigen ligase family protein [Candidatus Sumerlaeia bacterium]|nr:O-antigen ligase family protein [Candidatus Sumerlaeia bacterium]